MDRWGFDEGPDARARFEGQLFAGLAGDPGGEREAAVEAHANERAFGAQVDDLGGEVVAGAVLSRRVWREDDFLAADANEAVVAGRRSSIACSTRNSFPPSLPREWLWAAKGWF